MKHTKITIKNYHHGDLCEVLYDLFWEQFQENHPDLDKDELSDKFYSEVVTKHFQYGEYLDCEIEIDENLNIVGGKIISFKK